MPRLRIGEPIQFHSNAAAAAGHPAIQASISGDNKTSGDPDLLQEFSDLLEKISQRVSNNNADMAELLKAPPAAKLAKPQTEDKAVTQKQVAQSEETEPETQNSEQQASESDNASQASDASPSIVDSEQNETSKSGVAATSDQSTEATPSETAQAAAGSVNTNATQQVPSAAESVEQLVAQDANLPQRQTETEAGLTPFAQAFKPEQAVSSELKVDQKEIKQAMDAQQLAQANQTASAAGSEQQPAEGFAEAPAATGSEQAKPLTPELRMLKTEAAIPDSAPKANTAAAASLLPGAEQLSSRVQDVAIQSVLLKGMLDGLRSKGNETQAAQPVMNSFQLNAGAAATGRSQERARLPETLRNTRNVPLPDQQRALEKVQQAVKDASQSKDGKTISVRLDPPNLGRVKVDVSLRDGVLHARIVPELSQVGYLLRERAHELQNNLRRLGIEAEHVQVSIGSDASAEGSAFDNNYSSGSEQNNYGLEQGNFGSGLATQLQEPLARAGNSGAATLDHWVA